MSLRDGSGDANLDHGGHGTGSADGRLFRQGDALQGLSNIYIVAFDKTGTLTEGKPVLSEMRTFGEVEKAQALRLKAIQNIPGAGYHAGHRGNRIAECFGG